MAFCNETPKYLFVTVPLVAVNTEPTKWWIIIFLSTNVSPINSPKDLKTTCCQKHRLYLLLKHLAELGMTVPWGLRSNSARFMSLFFSESLHLKSGMGSNSFYVLDHSQHQMKHYGNYWVNFQSMNKILWVTPVAKQSRVSSFRGGPVTVMNFTPSSDSHGCSAGLGRWPTNKRQVIGCTCMSVI